MGLLHIYCGGGKGKTTAAIGLAVRASGAGMKVCFVQLMKGGFTSELSALKLLPNIEITRCDKDYGFVKNMSGTDKISIAECHNNLLRNAFSVGFDMIILDEFNAAYFHGLLDKKSAENFILNGKKNAEIILTGRNPAEIFINSADYISEIKCVKHPYKNGVSARRGIEF
ncbi:MAG: cob(I)yrinic acid a,c-diamide adenosyltransferase [Prevotella sp.]|nr:cob(I)yrinic acid a,c-diamide adenosyltransferase [Prevotella sp.]